MPGDVMLNQFAEEFLLAQNQIQPDTGVDIEVFNLRHGAHFPQEFNQIQPVALVIVAYFREKTA